MALTYFLGTRKASFSAMNQKMLLCAAPRQILCHFSSFVTETFAFGTSWGRSSTGTRQRRVGQVLFQALLGHAEGLYTFRRLCRRPCCARLPRNGDEEICLLATVSSPALGTGALQTRLTLEVGPSRATRGRGRAPWCPCAFASPWFFGASSLWTKLRKIKRRDKFSVLCL